jgi:hypothetical protein
MNDGKDDRIEQEDEQHTPGMHEIMRQRISGAAERAGDALNEHGERLKDGLHHGMEQAQERLKEHGKEIAADGMKIIAGGIIGLHTTFLPCDVSQPPPEHAVEIHQAAPSAIEVTRAYHAVKPTELQHSCAQEAQPEDIPDVPEDEYEPKWRGPEPPYPTQVDDPHHPKR